MVQWGFLHLKSPTQTLSSSRTGNEPSKRNSTALMNHKKRCSPSPLRREVGLRTSAKGGQQEVKIGVLPLRSRAEPRQIGNRRP